LRLCISIPITILAITQANDKNKRQTVIHKTTCPHCNKAFKINEAEYADILKQVRDNEFDQQLRERLELAEKDKKPQELKTKLNANEITRKHAITETLNKTEKRHNQPKNDLERAILENQLAEKAPKDKYETQIKNREGEIEPPQQEDTSVGQNG